MLRGDKRGATYAGTRPEIESPALLFGVLRTLTSRSASRRCASRLRASMLRPDMLSSLLCLFCYTSRKLSRGRVPEFPYSHMVHRKVELLSEIFNTTTHKHHSSATTQRHKGKEGGTAAITVSHLSRLVLTFSRLARRLMGCLVGWSS